MTFTASYLQQIIHFAGLRGAEPAALHAAAGLPLNWVCTQADERYPEPIYNALLKAATECTGDPWFGLHLGQWMNLAAAGLVGQIAASSATVGQALEHLCAYAALGCEALPLRLVRTPTEAAVILEPHPAWQQRAPQVVQQTVDFFLAFAVRDLAWLTLFQCKPLRVDWQRQAPRDASEAERILGCACRFGQNKTALQLDPYWLKKPVASANKHLLPVLLDQANQRLAAKPKKQRTRDAVEQVLFALQGEAFPNIESVAAALHLSPRTLQRRLKEEGTHFRAILDQAQDTLAKHYLSQSDHRLSEIAWLTGYRDAASLSRSFRRRHGIPPSRYRMEHASPST